MGSFLDQAEGILEIAASMPGQAQEYGIVLTRMGGLRLLDGGGWSLGGLLAEFGAAMAFRVEHRGAYVRVEGWDGYRRCLLQRERRSTGYIRCCAAGGSDSIPNVASRASSNLLISADPALGNSNVTISQSSETHRWLINRYSATSSQSRTATRIL